MAKLRSKGAPKPGSDQNSQAARTEMNALGAESISELIRIGGSSDLPVDTRVRACTLLGLLRPRDAVPVLLSCALRETDDQLVWAAMTALGSIRSRRATRPLIGILRSPECASKHEPAAYALWLLADRRAMRSLIQTLTDKTENEGTRGFAAEALGMFRPSPSIISALARALEDTSVNVRYSAVCALGGIGTDEAVLLIRGMQGDPGAIPGEGTVGQLATKLIQDADHCCPK